MRFPSMLYSTRVFAQPLSANTRAGFKRIATARWPRVALVALSLGGVAGCDTLKSVNPFSKGDTYKPEIVPVTPAEQLYNDGLSRLASNDFEGAHKTFDTINRQNPGSQWAQKSLIMQTYAAYEGGRYDDSANSATRYVSLYPNSQDAAYAQYLLAMSYYKQVPDVTRDQASTQRAIVAFDTLIQRYPKSEYATDAKFKLQVVRDQLAGHEMEVGRFYLKRRNYTAAINRFRTVVSQYQNTRATEEALMRLTEAYAALGVFNEAQTAAAVLGHNFPDSQWYKDAYTLLASRGLEPREDTGSWISKLFSGGQFR
ncbi:outer membrane protein assembly factor BamD [Pseudochelatococcus contaminans]|uniref:Outer membrane protein assembly factor BamD n=1 Tax=Pseudochelatococcus contaminans TaxID=1538103 RepID=A0A7W6EEK1_9HYPH|nr:outer membrane protein assembly factor BamD [Pseudochelatococcus contaminans]MBB3808264.1 outer membrane protein assembly factor BamD [Pseudochelatococcus contaminans]